MSCVTGSLIDSRDPLSEPLALPRWPEEREIRGQALRSLTHAEARKSVDPDC